MWRAIVIAVMLAASGAFAHSDLTTSSPANGETLASPPAEISFRFNKPIRLISVTLTTPDNRSFDLDISQTDGTARDFVLSNPSTGTGAFIVNWSGFGADGHLMRGAIGYDVTK